MRNAVKLTPRIDQRFQGVSQAEGQNDQRQKNLIFNLVQFALDHPNKKKLYGGVAEQQQTRSTSP